LKDKVSKDKEALSTDEDVQKYRVQIQPTLNGMRSDILTLDKPEDVRALEEKINNIESTLGTVKP
jgi:hypothetical protein